MKVFSVVGNEEVVVVVVVVVAAAVIVVAVLARVDDITTIHSFTPPRD